MAARTDAVAHGSTIVLVFLCFMFVYVSATHHYSWQELLDIGFNTKIAIIDVSRRTYNIPTEIARPPRAPWIVVGTGKRRRRRRERKQKRGCRSGLLS
ncbi:hypothetical protein N1851_023188 [Merluccius polli]|uniref:Uncharacterized protein n=1 Tax=Merluccius polli TaxID=89951 RepID=A0AA47NXU2_MERPO|nr:hypothetical protein N1851_023188 [Merluccius polli]